MAQCQGITLSGKPCRRTAVEGHRYCFQHQEQAPDITMIEEPIVPPKEIPIEDTSLPELETLPDLLKAALHQSIEQLQALTPSFVPPPLTPQAIMETMQTLLPSMEGEIAQQIKMAWESGDLFDPETWQGIWYIMSYTVNYQLDMIKRRFTGEYETDEWGLDVEFLEAVRPIFDFLYTYYWRVEVTGIEHLPSDGAGLIVPNHSGLLPFDSAMVGMAVLKEHPNERIVRTLYANWMPQVPFLAPFLEKLGQASANVPNGVRLLEQGELVAVYPEGYHGSTKPYTQRYRLASFGQGGFIRMALMTESVIVPTAVIGAEESYLTLGHSKLLGEIMGVPVFPISARFPWLGLLGLIPFPTKWYIDFGEPISLAGYGAGAVSKPALMKELAEEVRAQVQKMVTARLLVRKSILFGQTKR